MKCLCEIKIKYILLSYKIRCNLLPKSKNNIIFVKYMEFFFFLICISSMQIHLDSNHGKKVKKIKMLYFELDTSPLLEHNITTLLIHKEVNVTLTVNI